MFACPGLVPFLFLPSYRLAVSSHYKNYDMILAKICAYPPYAEISLIIRPEASTYARCYTTARCKTSSHLER